MASAVVVPIVDHQLKSAIAHRRLIEFTYSNVRRVAEPHDYGVLGGTVKLLVYQTRSTPFARGWRMLDVVKIERLEVLDRTFAGSRGKEHRDHYKWDLVLARVE